ncbi:MAG: DegV family EDD domain-containing protein [Lachnospiraceae bacterium]|nr:DegV family EDD domain-containing protein [Lachnospiraceae bacterium]
MDIDPAVPETLFGDEVRIKQILINLLNNAVKYTQKGSVALHMECEFPDAENALLKISVTDTGMGIKSDALPHLFDSFQRIDEEKNRYIEGTGLGLSIVKQLVELMGGEITVNSVYTQGSTFMVSLRQGISSDRRIGELNISNAGRISGSERFEHDFLAPEARILIVDDNEMNLQVEKKLLDGTGMTVDLSLSGRDALGRTLAYRYDAIFMDHLMPEMDGIECFEAIREQKGGLNTDTPVIVLTANAGGENVDLYNSTGFDGYLLKPVSGRALEEMLIQHLPAEKVIAGGNNEMTGAQMNTGSGYAKKKPVLIATSTMSDLPAEVLRELQISVIPYTVTTGEGVFFDTIDIDSEELVGYMGDEQKMVTSDPPEEDDFAAFFSEELKKAHQLIYITLTTGSSREYGRAKKAAETFENVTVVNSECLSSATGILVMIAARLAAQRVPADRIVAELEAVKHRIRCSFIIKSTDVMARRGHISPMINNILKTLWLRPVLRVKDDSMGVGRFFIGGVKDCYEKYVKEVLSQKAAPDTEFLFVTYVGMAEEELVWIENLIRERMNFEHIIFQKASAGIASNCGQGSFGLLFMEKGERSYSLGSIFAKVTETEEERESDTEGEKESDTDDEPASARKVNSDGGRNGSPEDAGETEEETSTGDKESPNGFEWYEKIPGIDASVALRNSGSKEALLSVLKIYYDSYETKSGEIQNFHESGDLKNYTIKVHALKSSSRLIGAVDLGNAAEKLEEAGNRSDTEYIGRNHQAMMEEYRRIREALGKEFEKGDDLPDIPEDMLSDAYAGLSEFADAMDFDLAKMVVDSVKEYRLPPEDKDRFSKLEALLGEMNWDGIKEILKMM